MVESTVIEPLVWDSEFFGIAIGRSHVTLDTIEAEVSAARATGVDCLYLIADALDTITVDHAVRLGATLVDLRIELAAAPPRFSASVDHPVRRAVHGDEHWVAGLARTLSDASRFARDPRFEPGAVAQMYELWASRCLHEGAVAVPNDKSRGFVGARAHDNATVIELVYVAPEVRGQQLAAGMIAEAVLYLPATEIRVATQSGNVSAQRLYQALGFRTRTSTAVLHLWLDSKTPSRAIRS